MSVIEREHVQVDVDPVREGRARVLEAAALEIEVRGWTTGTTGCNPFDGRRLCILGGIAYATGYDWSGSWYMDLGTHWGDSRVPYPAIYEFNDSRARDAQDVTFVLRWRAAEIRDGR